MCSVKENKLEQDFCSNEQNKNKEDILSVINNLDEDLFKTGNGDNIFQEIIETDEISLNPDENSETEFFKELVKIQEKRKCFLTRVFNKKNLYRKIKFVSYYVLISTTVFFILLGITNYNAYSKILYSYLNPNYLKNSSNEILDTINESKIKVYAEDNIDISEEIKKEQEEKLREKLEEENSLLKDTYFSPKKLVPLDSEINLNLEIVPYENRIIIPKIGKNVPLVDVDARSGLTPENLENIFMKELEKGVVRYPGTALPGEVGNSFIFGHSSNYPWIKGDYNEVFVLLDDLTFGDQIIIYYNQKKYTYIVKEKKNIRPGNIKILEREPGKKELTLMTCWPIGTALNRLIVIGELIETQ